VQLVIGLRIQNWVNGFTKKVEDLYNWAAERYDLEIVKSEDKWKEKYPNIAFELKNLEKRIKDLENRYK